MLNPHFRHSVSFIRPNNECTPTSFQKSDLSESLKKIRTLPEYRLISKFVCYAYGCKNWCNLTYSKSFHSKFTSLSTAWWLQFGGEGIRTEACRDIGGREAVGILHRAPGAARQLLCGSRHISRSQVSYIHFFLTFCISLVDRFCVACEA